MAERLDTALTAEVAAAEVVVVPIGSLEQHGPHLPLDTDTVVATAVASGLAARLDGAWVAPAVAYGASGEHQHFAGTSSIGTSAVRQVVVELVRSLRTWCPQVVLVNGHGGNLDALRAAVAHLRDEGHDVALVHCSVAGADAHAGRTETSLMLHLRPESVRLDLAERGNTAALASLVPAMRAGGVEAVSPNGVLGDPEGASAEEGERLLAAMVDNAWGRLGP